MNTLLAPIVQICDAISGARPGARREIVEAYIKRLNENELTAVSSGEYLKICNDIRRVSEHLINLIDTDFILNH